MSPVPAVRRQQRSTGRATRTGCGWSVTPETAPCARSGRLREIRAAVGADPATAEPAVPAGSWSSLVGARRVHADQARFDIQAVDALHFVQRFEAAPRRALARQL